jgi:hypothetical protein
MTTLDEAREWNRQARMLAKMTDKELAHWLDSRFDAAGKLRVLRILLGRIEE